MSCAQGNTSHRDFSYNGLIVRVSSGDLTQLSWLEEFLSPQFEVGEGASYDCKLTLIADTQRYEEILDMGARPEGGLVDCFALDSSLVQLPLWSSTSDDQIIYDEKFSVFYIVSQNTAEVGLLMRANNMAARTPLMRVVREFAMNHAHRTGHLVIHGSAFVIGGRGAIIAGPKEAGKTTLLIHVLRQGAVEYLSNDRVIVTFDEVGPTLRGMPTIVTVRQQTLEMFPPLRHRLLTSSYHSRLTLSEATQRPHRPVRPGKNGQFSLSPAQFCELLQVKATAQGHARGLVFPRVTGRSGMIDLEQLSAEAAAVRLIESLFRARSSQKVTEVFTLSGHGSRSDKATLERLCLRLTSQVRCFECRMGEEAYQDETSAAMFIRRVVGYPLGLVNKGYPACS